MMKVDAETAMGVAQEFLDVLGPQTERIIVAGSLRRRRPMVSDVEILFIPKLERMKDDGDLFGHARMTNMAERAIAALLAAELIEKRLKSDGTESWGLDNKLCVHTETAIPVDLFTASNANWFNYLVCRTGGAENNVRICNKAIDRGWKWNPYGSGFSRDDGKVHPVTSEREVFEFVGLQYLEPWER